MEMRELAELGTRRGGSCEAAAVGGEGAGELEPAAERTLRLNSSLSSDIEARGCVSGESETELMESW